MPNPNELNRPIRAGGQTTTPTTTVKTSSSTTTTSSTTTPQTSSSTQTQSTPSTVTPSNSSSTSGTTASSSTTPPSSSTSNTQTQTQSSSSSTSSPITNSSTDTVTSSQDPNTSEVTPTEPGSESSDKTGIIAGTSAAAGALALSLFGLAIWRNRSKKRNEEETALAMEDITNSDRSFFDLSKMKLAGLMLDFRSGYYGDFAASGMTLPDPHQRQEFLELKRAELTNFLNVRRSRISGSDESSKDYLTPGQFRELENWIGLCQRTIEKDDKMCTLSNDILARQFNRMANLPRPNNFVEELNLLPPANIGIAIPYYIMACQASLVNKAERKISPITEFQQQERKQHFYLPGQAVELGEVVAQESSSSSPEGAHELQQIVVHEYQTLPVVDIRIQKLEDFLSPQLTHEVIMDLRTSADIITYVPTDPAELSQDPGAAVLDEKLKRGLHPYLNNNFDLARNIYIEAHKCAAEWAIKLLPSTMTDFRRLEEGQSLDIESSEQHTYDRLKAALLEGMSYAAEVGNHKVMREYVDMQCVPILTGQVLESPEQAAEEGMSYLHASESARPRTSGSVEPRVPAFNDPEAQGRRRTATAGSMQSINLGSETEIHFGSPSRTRISPSRPQAEETGEELGEGFIDLGDEDLGGAASSVSYRPQQPGLKQPQTSQHRFSDIEAPGSGKSLRHLQSFSEGHSPMDDKPVSPTTSRDGSPTKGGARSIPSPERGAAASKPKKGASPTKGAASKEIDFGNIFELRNPNFDAETMQRELDAQHAQARQAGASDRGLMQTSRVGSRTGFRPLEGQQPLQPGLQGAASSHQPKNFYSSISSARSSTDIRPPAAGRRSFHLAGGHALAEASSTSLHGIDFSAHVEETPHGRGGQADPFGTIERRVAHMQHDVSEMERIASSQSEESHTASNAPNTKISSRPSSTEPQAAPLSPAAQRARQQTRL